MNKKYENEKQINNIFLPCVPTTIIFSITCLLCTRMIFILGLFVGCLMTLFNCNGYELLTNENYMWCTGERWLVNML